MSLIPLRFSNVTKQFPHSVFPVLTGVNLEVTEGKIHTIIGFSGAGKSVTLKHALGLILPDSGDVFVYGKSIGEMDEMELRSARMSFGMLFQNSALFDSLTVFDNIAFPLREHAKKMTEEEVSHRVHELLGQVGMHDVAHKFPSELSGGMQKRVGLARAIALKPKILLFDEPTTGLDPVTSQLIDDLIVETTYKLGASSLIISHDVRAALRFSDIVSMLFQGKIIETAPPQEFKASGQEAVQHFLKVAGVI